MSDEALTNKERRLARKAEKQKQRAALPDEKSAQDEASHSVKRPVHDAEVPADVADEPHDPGEEPLSHKERRKRRKMEKQAEFQEEEQAPRPQRLQRSAFCVWIGNLPFSTTVEELSEWLSENEVEGVSRVHMTPGARRDEHNKGFAYVDLPSEAEVNKCVALSETMLHGRRLLIKNGNDFRGRPGLDPSAAELGGNPAGGRTGLTKTAQRILRAQKNPPAPTLFMGNLSFETTDDDIRELLEGSARRRHMEGIDADDADAAPPQAGIRKIRMGTFEDTGKCKGFAFIDFDSAAQATKALIEPRNARLLGRTLQLEFAGVDAVRRGASKDLLPDYVPGRRRRRPTQDAQAPPRDPSPSVPDTPEEAEPAATDAPTASRRKASAPRRLRPGAANASAPRQSYGIVPSEGKRTTFE
ncbi:Nucleolar protein 13 [Malassezia caprae]|uniref:Nucleolar protein 13 n=1 Tax=Malassezia caprae TaxID=1381934 RepID=A0AAF0J0K1_9BASI|nr:Nucleolar protein 13 [Malassezia caprae]